MKCSFQKKAYEFSLSIKPQERAAVILGNGSSLRGFNFAKELEGFDTFGMNSACRHWHTIGWYPNYYAGVDPIWGYSLKDEIANLVRHKDIYGIKAFLLRQNLVKYLERLGNPEYIINYDFWLIRNKYHLLIQSPNMTTGTAATLWAATLGYKRLILLGMDAHYPAGYEASLGIKIGMKGMAGKYSIFKKKSQINLPSAINENYFFDEYHKKGDKIFTPEKDEQIDQMHYEAWLFMPAVLRIFDTEVVNANPTSKIDVFPKCPWSEAKETFV